MQPVNQDRCLRASKSGRDVELGKLEPIGEDTYQTIHKLEIRYKWPKKYSSQVTNFVLQEIEIHYHMNNGHMTTGLDDMATCNIKVFFAR